MTLVATIIGVPVLTYIGIRTKRINLIARFICSVLIFVINNIFIHRYLEIKEDVISDYVLPMVASLIMGAGALILYIILYKLTGLFISRTYFVNLVSALPSIAAAILIYAFVLLRLGVIGSTDILALPKGQFILRVLKKLKWV